jgi:ABC-2 type transport system ATP-binding protein
MELDIAGLSKQYKGNVWGLKDFSLNLRPGILGLLGPNGAGKSTLMRILATVTRPTEGTVQWKGQDIVAHPTELRRRLGYLPQDFGVYPQLTAVEFLQYIAAAKGLHGSPLKRRLDDLLLLVNLHDSRKRPVGGFSGGMRQRVGIAAALLNDPLVLIVDEPTAGLDPEERVRFRNLLADLAGDRIVILSTHIVSDVESSATHLAIMNRGQLIISAAPEQMLASLEGKVFELTIAADQLPHYRDQYLVTGVLRRPDGLRIRVVSPTSMASAALVTPTLEDVYLWHIMSARSRAAA